MGKKFLCALLVVILVITSFVSMGTISSAAAEAPNAKPNVIPSLREWNGGTGTFTMGTGSRICVDPAYDTQLTEAATAFKEDITAMNGYSLSIVSSASPAAGDFFLTLNCSDNGLGDEGYSFETGNYVTIRALNKTGVFYGTRTALQIMVQSAGKNIIPQGTARDYPKWKSRGFMLDVGRMPFSFSTIKDYVKFMAYYKMNDFQLHLNDNAWVDSNDWTKTYAAFRLDSTAYPGLSAKDLYYTKAQFRDLQDTARKYSTVIVPEIDSPAHAAAFTEYRPDLAHPTSKDFLNLANPDTYTFMDALWNEFLPEFDSPVVHMGTDEYDSSAADNYKTYINHTNSVLKNKGKKARMWGSLGQMGGATGVDRDIIVDLWSTYWYNPQTAIADGYQIINAHDNDLYIVPKATYYHDYLDCKYLYEKWEPYNFGGAGYDLSPTEPNLLGGKFCVWNDNLGHGYDIYDVYDRVKPAMQTLAEKLWSGQTGVSYDTFFNNSLLIGNAPGTSLEYPVIQGNGNLAAGKTSYASSVETGTTSTANKAFDGRINTRWASEHSDNSWIYVDLGQSQTINRVKLNWEAAYGKSYKIQVSNDAVNWSDVYSTTGGDGGIDDINFNSVSARYVRMQGVQRATTFGYSLYEFQVFAPTSYSATVISTFAGSDSNGYFGDGGPATNAGLNTPTAVVADGSGNIYIADSHNHTIRKVSSDGTINTVVGTGIAGNSGDGGPAISAQLYYPQGLALDNGGNLYIADAMNQNIRKVSPNGIISTIAGTGTYGYSGDGGPAISAQLGSPSGVAVDGNENIFIADYANSRIRKIGSNGIISTVVGTGASGYSGDGGQAVYAKLNWPSGITFDNNGNMYIADSYNNRIRKVDSSGVISTIAGTDTAGYAGDGSTALSAQLFYPTGLSVDSSGNVYIADQHNNRIRKIDTQGIIVTVAGNGDTSGSLGDGEAPFSAQLFNPAGVVVNGSGDLYIADSFHNRVRKVTASTNGQTEIAVKEVTLNKVVTAIVAGQSEQLNATVAPSNATNKNVTWTVTHQSAGNIVTVSSTGLVTAVNAGTAVIRATSLADNSKYADCTINVSQAEQFPGEDAPIFLPAAGSEPALSGVQVSSNGNIQSAPEINSNGIPETIIKTEDMEKAFSQTSSDDKGDKTVVVEVDEVKGAKEYLQQLPAKTFSSGADKKKIEINTPCGTVTLPCNMFGTQEITNTKNIGISIGNADTSKLQKDIKSKIGNRPVIELTTTIDDKNVAWKNENAPVEVSVDYTPTAEELKDVEHIVVWYIDANGNAVSVPSGRYDAATGKITFTTTHFSKYAVAYVEKSFNDLGKYSWAVQPIEVLASKGIVEGVSDTKFSPEKKITRAEFIGWLVKTLGLTANVDTNFDDVCKKCNYYQEIGIAKKLGITSGVGENKFNPTKEISRQDMMVLTVKALKVAGRTLSNGSLKDIEKYNDAAKVAGYAVENVAAMVKEGLIVGSGNKLNPTASISRAEVSVVLYKIYTAK